MRQKLATHLYTIELESSETYDQDAAIFARIRDTTQVLRNMLKKRSEDLAGFSMAQAIYDISSWESAPRFDSGLLCGFIPLLIRNPRQRLP